MSSRAVSKLRRISTSKKISTGDDSAHELEQSFCQDFSCCGNKLKSLHDLLEHYESVHVRVEEESSDNQNSSSVGGLKQQQTQPSQPQQQQQRPLTAPKLPSPSERNTNEAPNAFKMFKYYFNDICYNNYDENSEVFWCNDDGYAAFDDAVVKKKQCAGFIQIPPGAGHQYQQEIMETNQTDGFTTDEEPYAAVNSPLAAALNNPETQNFIMNSYRSHMADYFGPTNLYTVAPSLLSSSEDENGDSESPSFYSHSNGAHQMAIMPNTIIPSSSPSPLSNRLKRSLSAMKSSSDTGSINGEKVKKYQCLVPGCIKTYRNQNGLKYHIEHGHSQCEREIAEELMRAIREDPTEKPYACQVPGCAKRYRNSNGLKYHLLHHHDNINDLYVGEE